MIWSVIWFALMACGDAPSDDSGLVDSVPEPELTHQLSFAVLADPHITSYSERDERLRAAVTWLNEEAEHVELVFVVGDIGWSGGLEPAREMLGALNVPYVPIMGDNEVATGDQEAFDQVFSPVYDELAATFEGFTRGAREVYNPEWEETSWFQNFSFTYKGLRFVGLDWNARGDQGVLGELGNLHDFEGGTFPWFADAIDGLPEGQEEDTLMFSHHPMHTPAFVLDDMAAIASVTAPHAHRVAGNWAGHYHVNHEEDEVDDAGYALFVTDATWDDELTVRVVDVWGNGERFEHRQALVELEW